MDITLGELRKPVLILRHAVRPNLLLLLTGGPLPRWEDFDKLARELGIHGKCEHFHEGDGTPEEHRKGKFVA